MSGLAASFQRFFPGTEVDEWSAKPIMLHAHLKLSAASPLQLPPEIDLELKRAQLELDRWRTRLRFQDVSARTVHPRGADRSYVRLPTAGSCEVWLICWPPGSRAPLHDHGTASALATMLNGELCEWLKPASSAAVERTWRGDNLLEIPVNARHEVWNASENTAYSLHVYTPRLASMTFYERTDSGELRTLHREEAQQW